MAEDQEKIETAPVVELPTKEEPSETVKAILARNERNTEAPVKEEEKKEEVVETEKEVEKKDEKPAPPLLTEEMAKEYPYLKTMIGKPLTEVFKAQQSLLRTWNRDRQELSELKKVKAEPVNEKLPTLDEFVQKGLDDAKIDFPDPLEDPKGFKAANRKEAILAQKLADEWRDKKNQPEKKQADADRQTRAERDALETTVKILNAKIPDKTTDELDKIAEGYAAEIQDILQESPKLYEGRPELLASDIAAWYYATELKRSKEDIQAKIDNAKKNTTQKVKAAMKDQQSNIHSVKDGEPEKKLSVNLQKIKERAERMNSQ